MFGCVSTRMNTIVPVYEKVMEQYGKLAEDIKAGRVLSAYATGPARRDRGGEQDGLWKRHGREDRAFHVIQEICLPRHLERLWRKWQTGKVGELAVSYTVIGEVTDERRVYLRRRDYSS